MTKETKKLLEWLAMNKKIKAWDYLVLELKK
jgi:hypothetical protein